jgi:lipopolysaccharide export system protein LptC
MTHFSDKFIYVFLSALALLSWWLLQYSGLIETKKTAASKKSPDYYSKGYTKWEMDENGRLKSKLVAEEMTHSVNYWATHTKKPIMYFYNENKPPWIIESETGVLSKDGVKLQLNGKVKIIREIGEGVRPLTVNTSNLMVNPKTSYAETKAWAELISPPHVTTGTGMKVTFKEPIHLELLSKVKGKYETK